MANRAFRPVDLKAVSARNQRAIAAQIVSASLRVNSLAGFSALVNVVQIIRESQEDVAGLIAEVTRLRTEKKALLLVLAESTGADVEALEKAMNPEADEVRRTAQKLLSLLK